MAKSARASVKKSNRTKLRARVFGPVEDARTQRLHAKLLEAVQGPKPEPPKKSDMDVDSEESTAQDAEKANAQIEAEAEAEADEDEYPKDMDVDSDADADADAAAPRKSKPKAALSKTQLKKISEEKRANKQAGRKTRNQIRFMDEAPKKKGAKQGKKSEHRVRKRRLP